MKNLIFVQLMLLFIGQLSAQTQMPNLLKQYPATTDIPQMQKDLGGAPETIPEFDDYLDHSQSCFKKKEGFLPDYQNDKLVYFLWNREMISLNWFNADTTFSYIIQPSHFVSGWLKGEGDEIEDFGLSSNDKEDVLKEMVVFFEEVGCPVTTAMKIEKEEILTP